MNGASRHADPVAQAWQRLRADRAAMTSLGLLAALVLLALAAPWVAVHDPATQDLALGPTPPSAAHWFGTDLFGRDLFARVLYGGRISLAVGALATVVALTIGVAWGTIAGYTGGRVDALMMRIVDILYALPFAIFVILLTVAFGSSLLLLFVAIGCVEWLTMARIVRAQVMTVRQQPYVDAAIALGLTPWRIMVAHVLPNVLGPVVVYATLTVPGVILLESFLSFLGLGVQPPDSSWGVLIAHGVETMEEYPWLLLWPAAFLSVTLFALNYLGDGLRDMLDPRVDAA
jgi:oligopeptide transport system permease protein